MTADALRRIPGLDVKVAGRGARRCDLTLDLADPATFGRSDPFDVVVGCADSHAAPPDELATHVARRGGAFVDTSADAGTCLRLLDLAKSGIERGSGLIVVGAGAMPGISNLLAAAAVRERGGAELVELFLSWSVLSGAGPGTVEIMSRGLAVPNRRYERGRLVAGPPVGRRVRVPIRGGWRTGFESGFPESAMLGRSLGVASTSTVLAVTPSLPAPALSVLSNLARRGFFSASAVRSAMRLGMRTVRGRLLLRRATGVTMLAAADRPADDFERACGLGIRASDAFRAAGAATAALAVAAANSVGKRNGIVAVEELCSLDDLLVRMRRIGTVEIERFSWEGPASAMA